MNKEDKRGIFFGVVGVLTLIVAIIGASLAYFSLNANSDPDALTVQAASVQIVYEDGDKLNVSEIIPATQAVAVETFSRFLNKKTYKPTEESEDVLYEKCKDDNGYNVCGTYNFKLTNDGPTATTISMTVNPATTEGKKFKNLSYILYDVTGLEEDTYTVDGKPVSDYKGLGTPTIANVLRQGTFEYEADGEGNVTSYKTTTILANDEENKENNVSIASKDTMNLRLFVWLNEVSTDEEDIAQDYEQGAVFQGSISIAVVGAENGKVTGDADSSIGA